MKRVIVLLIAGTLLSAVGAVWASAHSKSQTVQRHNG
jgi:cell division protein FtsL